VAAACPPLSLFINEKKDVYFFLQRTGSMHLDTEGCGKFELQLNPIDWH
jgi:hypothetical protein